MTGKFQREYDLLLARVEYRASKDAFKACALLNRSGHTIEGQLLMNLKNFGKDLVGALNTVSSKKLIILTTSFLFPS